MPWKLKPNRQLCLLSHLTFKDAAFEPHLKKIDEIDSSLTDLERTMNALDAYTLRLENKFKYLKENRNQPYKKLPANHQI